MATLTTALPVPTLREAKASGRGFWRDAWARLRLNRAAMVGLAAIALLILAAAFAPLLAPYDYAQGDLLHGSEPPGRAHLLGTDELGRDILSRLLFGARVSLSVALAAQVVIVVVGVPIGLLTGYLGGLVDMVLMRVIDAIYGLPNLLIAVIIMSSFRSNISQSAKGGSTWLTSLDKGTDGLIGIFLVLSLTHWLTVSRLVRAQVLAIKRRDHVDAARTLGATGPRIVRHHILPLVLAPVVIAVAFGVPGAIMLEASLSFLGIGVNPPTPSWGLMISSGLTNMRSHPYMLTAPALALGLTLLAFTFLGDGLRDAMDPHMKT